MNGGEQLARRDSRPREDRRNPRELLSWVLELPDEDRRSLTGNLRATMIDVAEYLNQSGFDQFRALIPKRPARRALEPRPRGKYRLHMVDALALVVAQQNVKVKAQSPDSTAGHN